MTRTARNNPERMARLWISVLVAFLMVSLLTQETSGALLAQTSYAMDQPSDCVAAGILDVSRGQEIYIQGTSAPVGRQRSCTLQFQPQTKGDTLKLSFSQSSSFGDCGVSLSVNMMGDQARSFSCNTPKPFNPMQKMDGHVIFRLVRPDEYASNYNFQIYVTAFQATEEAPKNSSSSDDVGMIVGIVAGVVVIILLVCIICCCCLKKRRRERKHAMLGQSTTEDVVGVDNRSNWTNKTADQSYPPSNGWLLRETSFDSEDSGKPKSALERFGPTPSKPRTSERMLSERMEDEREAPRPTIRRQVQPEPQDSRPPRSPVLSDLHNNPRFRRSFHENENAAEERIKRVSRASESPSSSVSVDSQGVPLPPKLPPVPKSPQRSPSPQRRGEKIAGIFRARPSSSSSELAKQLGDSDDDENVVSGKDSRRDDGKPDTRHTLRPDRKGRRSRPDEDEDSDEEERRRRRRRRDEEKERRRRQEEEEEDEEEERARRKEHERRKRKEEQRRQREEEEEDERRRRRREREQEDSKKDYEGRFKKSSSGRKSKGKGPRMGRSRSTGTTLDDMESNYQRSRSKSPSSVRSLNFIEDDDDDDYDLDSNYMPFKRSGSKQSLYASRSSLYGRRRKNSMGETLSLSSYAHDDMDSRYGDFDKRGLSRGEKDRMFKSTGELEMQLATAQVVRECATQTDSEKSVYVYGKKTLAKSRPRKMYSRGSQTQGRERRDSTGSARSGKSGKSSRSNPRLKKSRSQESLRNKRSRSKNRYDDYEDDDTSSDRYSRRPRSRSRPRDDYTDDDDDDKRSRRKHHRSKSRGMDDDDSDRISSKGRSRPRKSTGAASVDLSDSDDDGKRSVAASSVAPSSVYMPAQQPPYGAQYVPVGYPMAYPQPGVAYLPTAPGGPPMANGSHQRGPKPPVAPKPKKSNWDTLVALTEDEKHRRRQVTESPTETESMYSSAFPLPHNGQAPQSFYPPPSYRSAQKYPNPDSTFSSAYPTSSGLPISDRGPRDYKLSSYAPSESNI